MIRTAFMPTMSGHLHLGGLYNAYLNWKYAKDTGGEFGIRIDGQVKTDGRLEFADSIIEDLKLFGMEPNFILRQYEQVDFYRRIFEEQILIRNDIYFCDCTEQDIVERMAEGKWPIPCRAVLRPYKHELFQHHKAWYKYRVLKTSHYDDYCRDRGLKLDLDDPRTTVRLKCTFPLDIVLWMEKHAELAWTSAFDNKELGITHSIDGIDLQSFSWLETQATRTLGCCGGYRFKHIFHGLIVDNEGYKLSKKEEAKRITEYGIEPGKIIKALENVAKLGNTEPIKESVAIETARRL